MDPSSPSTLERLRALESKARDADRDRGFLESVNDAVTALTSAREGDRRAIDALAVDFAHFAREAKKRDLATRKSLQRATAAPLALVAFLVSGQLGATTLTTTTVTLVVVFLALFHPEALQRFAASPAPPSGANGAANGHDKPH